jgi:Secretion system C-terminal sorting domain
MKCFLLVSMFAICLLPAFAQEYTGQLDAKGRSFNRPEEGTPPAALSFYTAAHYKIIPITVAATGPLVFESTSPFDNFMVLYNTNGFTPAMPLVNALVANDDFNGSSAGFSYNFSAAGNYYLVMTSFKNSVVGAYTVSVTPGVVLPVNLLSFTAGKAPGNTNTIKWSGLEEQNLAGYQVQRSIDNKTFSDLAGGNIAARNNTQVVSYSFKDNEPAAGYNYYRLKIKEATGRVSYSQVALVKHNKLGVININLFPNPATDFLQLEAKSMQNIKAYITIINVTGVIMLRSQLRFNNQGELPVDIRKLPAGKYFLKTAIDKDEATMIFIKN